MAHAQRSMRVRVVVERIRLARCGLLSTAAIRCETSRQELVFSSRLDGDDCLKEGLEEMSPKSVKMPSDRRPSSHPFMIGCNVSFVLCLLLLEEHQSESRMTLEGVIAGPLRTLSHHEYVPSRFGDS